MLKKKFDLCLFTFGMKWTLDGVFMCFKKGENSKNLNVAQLWNQTWMNCSIKFTSPQKSLIFFGIIYDGFSNLWRHILFMFYCCLSVLPAFCGRKLKVEFHEKLYKVLKNGAIKWIKNDGLALNLGTSV